MIDLFGSGCHLGLGDLHDFLGSSLGFLGWWLALGEFLRLQALGGVFPLDGV